MSTYLITGARSPAALDIAKNLKRHGHRIIMADCWRFPISKGSRYVNHYQQVASPRFHFAEFKQDILRLVREYQVEHIIPVCEEIFYLAKLKSSLPKHVELFADDKDKLIKLHDKFDVGEMAKGCDINIPKTRLLSDITCSPEASSLGQSDSGQAKDNDSIKFNLKNHVIKRRLSRFGCEVYTDLNPTLFNKLKTEKSQGYLLQEKITGTEYCTYSIAKEGKVNFHITYQPTLRIKNSASFHFTPIAHQLIENFIQKFVKKHNFTGHISFDIIDDNNKIYLIECNPRVSSGVHFIKNIDMAALFAGQTVHYSAPKQDLKLSYAMLLTGLPQALRQGQLTQWRKAWQQAKDAVYDRCDKRIWTYQFISFAEVFYRMLRYGKGFRAISTVDIEWS